MSNQIKHCSYCRADYSREDREHWYVRDSRPTDLECKKRISDRHQRDRKENAQYLRNKYKSWYKENRDYNIQRAKEYSKSLKGRFRVLKSNAKRRNINVDLSFEEYVEIVNEVGCYYCGSNLPESGAGIDRLSSDLGYCRDNCVPCCTTCNLAKHTQSNREFLNWIERVYKHMQLGG